METKSNQNTILRVTKNTNFTTISNFHLKDINLSWGAKGLLTYFLTLPNDWKIYVSYMLFLAVKLSFFDFSWLFRY